MTTLATIDTADATTLKPGIYANMPAEEYHRLPGASASRLSDLRRSPLHAWYRMRTPCEPTAAKEVGTLVHNAILEPSRLLQYLVAEQCCATTKKGTQCTYNGSVCNGSRWYCGTHIPAGFVPDPIEIVSPGNGRGISGAVKAALAHEAASDLLNGASERELSIFWTDEETGVLCKARCDGVDAGRGILLDLKTTLDASPESFVRSFVNYGYHRQLAHYVDGLAAVGRPVDSVAVIAVEKEPPFGVAVYEVPPEALDLGRRELRPLLDRWAECMALDGPWPGYVGIEGVLTLNLPAWAFKEQTPALA